MEKGEFLDQKKKGITQHQKVLLGLNSYYIEHTLHDLFHWAEKQGVKWVDMKPQEGNSVMRWTRPERSGLGLMTNLIQSFRDKGGEIVNNTEITKIKMEGKRAVGFEGVNSETGEKIESPQSRDMTFS